MRFQVHLKIPLKWRSKLNLWNGRRKGFLKIWKGKKICWSKLRNYTARRSKISWIISLTHPWHRYIGSINLFPLESKLLHIRSDNMKYLCIHQYIIASCLIGRFLEIWLTFDDTNISAIALKKYFCYYPNVPKRI